MHMKVKSLCALSMTY